MHYNLLYFERFILYRAMDNMFLKQIFMIRSLHEKNNFRQSTRTNHIILENKKMLLKIIKKMLNANLKVNKMQ